jgi:hypothetical protein
MIFKQGEKVMKAPAGLAGALIVRGMRILYMLMNRAIQIRTISIIANR